jgi:hypothetical protein
MAALLFPGPPTRLGGSALDYGVQRYHSRFQVPTPNSIPTNMYLRTVRSSMECSMHVQVATVRGTPYSYCLCPSRRLSSNPKPYLAHWHGNYSARAGNCTPLFLGLGPPLGTPFHLLATLTWVISETIETSYSYLLFYYIGSTE